MDEWSAPATADVVDELDESRLVAAAQDGDAAAMERLLARHFNYVNALCRRMMRDSFDAEDARQDALFQTARRIATFDARSSFRTWLHTITKNVCLNKIRSEARDRQRLCEEPPEHISAVKPHDPVAARLDVEAALRAISPVFHDALVLWFMFDFSYEQIAETLGIPLNTVRSRLRRGRAELAGLLHEPLTSTLRPAVAPKPPKPRPATASPTRPGEANT